MKNKPKGTKDYFGEELDKLETITKLLESIIRKYDFEKIVLPTFENIELFKRAIGEQTDIISKEMFELKSKGKENFVLRPEGTAPAVRFFLENKLDNINDIQKYFYIDKMFRYERPQKGRMREFYQLGVEIFNDNSLEIQVEVFLMIERILKTLKIEKYILEINCIGDLQERENYKNKLKSYLETHLDSLSEESKLRFSLNPLRILDSKDEVDKNILKNAPSILDSLSEESRLRFEKFQKNLKDLNIEFKVNHLLIRGLDYYNDLVFEFVSTDNENLGSNSTIIAGGRYDTLVSQVEHNKKIDAFGFAIGIERLILATSKHINEFISKSKKILVTSIEEKYNKNLFEVSELIRGHGYNINVDYSEKNLSKKISKYIKKDYDFFILIGEEIKEDKIIVKDLKMKKQHEIYTKDIKKILDN